jgi:hypothetical protein
MENLGGSGAFRGVAASGNASGWEGASPRRMSERNCDFLRSVERYPHRVRIRPKMGRKRMPDGVVNCPAPAAGAENLRPLVAQRNSRLDCDEKDPPLARFELRWSSGEAL